MTSLGVCAHCAVGVLASSVGPVHSDTHNTQGSDGHHAAVAHIPFRGEMGNTPVDLSHMEKIAEFELGTPWVGTATLYRSDGVS